MPVKLGLTGSMSGSHTYRVTVVEILLNMIKMLASAYDLLYYLFLWTNIVNTKD